MYVPHGLRSEQAASDVSKDYFALLKSTCFTYPHCVPCLGEAWRWFCTTRVYSLCCLSATDLSPGHMHTSGNKRDIFVSSYTSSGRPNDALFLVWLCYFCTAFTLHVIKKCLNDTVCLSCSVIVCEDQYFQTQINVATTNRCLKCLCNTEAYVGRFTEFTHNNEEPRQNIWHNE